MANRPSGTDGSDFQYRQVIHNKYKKRAAAKRTVTVTTYLVLPSHIIRALWQCFPIWIGVGDATTYTWPILAGALVSVILQLAGLSTKPQPSHRILMVSNVIMVFVTVASILVFWLYHTMAPKHQLYPELGAQYLMKSYGWQYTTVQPVLTTVEAISDILSIGFSGLCSLLTFNYVMDISGKNEKSVGTRWNPRMAHTSTTMEELRVPEQKKLK
mmetsp:Transcript_9655/g.27620  ORF Transcript_9655/g.27620 Transcript_9655/m.27620 type:complete len:214 (-) Transcript_9655:161-802(-)